MILYSSCCMLDGVVWCRLGCFDASPLPGGTICIIPQIEGDPATRQPRMESTLLLPRWLKYMRFSNS